MADPVRKQVFREGSRVIEIYARTSSVAVSNPSKGQLIREGYPHLCSLVLAFPNFKLLLHGIQKPHYLPPLFAYILVLAYFSSFLWNQKTTFPLCFPLPWNIFQCKTIMRNGIVFHVNRSNAPQSISFNSVSRFKKTGII